ncbi:MAG: PEP-CTERM sorting domain-containing protein [Verrucomicrobiota bacterium]
MKLRYLTLFTFLFLVIGADLSSGATTFTIDFRQSADDVAGGGADNAGLGTWSWRQGMSAQADSFSLDFASSTGPFVSLDNSVASDLWKASTENANDYTHGLISVSYQGGTQWAVFGTNQTNTNTFLGTITEYSGAPGHTTNYNYQGVGVSNDESSPLLGGGPKAEIDSQTFSAWLWIYRETATNTVSLNLVSGSWATPMNDGGVIRDVEFNISGGFVGTPSLFASHETELTQDAVDGPDFTGDWNWVEGFNDGGSLGGITPIPEPGTAALLALAGVGFLIRRRKS